MTAKIDYKVNSREQLFFYLRLLASLGLYALIAWLIYFSLTSEDPKVRLFDVFYFYIGLILLYLFFRFGILIGYLKGNAVKLGKNQFPELYSIVETQSDLLGLKSVPKVFILQSGGVLNAFATRFLGRNYIVLYSEIVETAWQQDIRILEFIIGHELGHIKRNHMLKNMLFLPTHLIPFLSSAYSRACEYTCDNIGHALSPSGAGNGLLVLASGKSLFRKVSVRDYIHQDVSEDGFWKWFAEITSSHPNLTRRLAVFAQRQPDILIPVQPQVKEIKESDHSKFMPRSAPLVNE